MTLLQPATPCRAKDKTTCSYHGALHRLHLAQQAGNFEAYYKARSELAAVERDKAFHPDFLIATSTLQEVAKPADVPVDFAKIQAYYDEEQGKLASLYEAEGQGAVRHATGQLFEKMIDLILENNPTYKSIVGSQDYISTRYEHPTMGLIAEQSNLQVDRHIHTTEGRSAFVESKTYLDKPYLERAASDFLEVKRALDQQGEDTSKLKFFVFAGKSALSDDAQKVQRAKFWTESAKNREERVDMHIYFVCKGKRSSKEPLYSNKWELNYSEIQRFANEFTPTVTKTAP